MNEQKRQATHDCPPRPKEPAPQPRAPGGKDGCADLPISQDPEPVYPKPCEPTKSDCQCPELPTSKPSCLETLIASQAAGIAAGKKAEAFKTDLEKLLGTAKAASLEYTREKYDALVKQWLALDKDIAAFIRKLTCAVPCWRCVIECHVCPILNDLRDAERRLCGDGTSYAEVHNLYDLQYWRTRDRDAKERVLNRVKLVLAAWEKPGGTIEAILKANRNMLDALDKSPSSDSGKVLCDLFLRLVPLHLAIAPPASSEGLTTYIDEKYTEFCDCDVGVPDDCCGPDVGQWSLRQRLNGPQPYLIDPSDYFKIICCLVEKRYEPAQLAFAAADAALATVDSEIKQLKAQLDSGLKRDAFDKAVKAVVPSPIDCCSYEHDDDDDDYGSTSTSTSTRAR